MFSLQNGVNLGLWSKYTCEPAIQSLGSAFEVAFSTEDIDTVYGNWEKLHVTIAQKPCDMDFGRTFVALDPDGHRIRVFRLFE